MPICSDFFESTQVLKKGAGIRSSQLFEDFPMLESARWFSGGDGATLFLGAAFSIVRPAFLMSTHKSRTITLWDFPIRIAKHLFGFFSSCLQAVLQTSCNSSVRFCRLFTNYLRVFASLPQTFSDFQLQKNPCRQEFSSAFVPTFFLFCSWQPIPPYV